MKSRRNARRAFSFTEILFAIMILGIGFIMVAAMFPVAMQQTQQSQSENAGAGIARSAVAIVQNMGSSTFYKLNPNTPGANGLCVLRPTIQFPGLGIFDDQDLYLAIQPGGAINPNTALPTYPPGDHVINGEVWDFCPVAPKSFGAEPVAYIQTNGTLTALNPVENLSAVLMLMVSQNAVQQADPRYGWVAFYKRDLIETVSIVNGVPAPTLSYAPSAQVIIVAAQVRNKQTYTLASSASGVPMLDLPQINPTSYLTVSPPPSLQASRSSIAGGAGSNPATITNPSTTGTALTDSTISFNDPIQAQRAAEGAFVIIAADAPNRVLMTNQTHGALNGRIYRLGAANPIDPSGATYNFAPGYGPSASDQGIMGQTAKYLVYLVGRGIDPEYNPTSPGAQSPYSGLAQDIAVYSTFISCPQN